MGRTLFPKSKYGNPEAKESYRKMAYILEYLSVRHMASYGALVADYLGADVYDPTALRYAVNQLLKRGDIENCIHPQHGRGYYRRTLKNGKGISTPTDRAVRQASAQHG